MKSDRLQLIRSAGRAALASVLAASTLAFAQNSSVPATSNSSQQNTETNGGWKRVGEQSQVYTPAAPDSASQEGDVGGGQAPDASAQPSYPQQNYPQQQPGPSQQAYPQQPYPNNAPVNNGGGYPQNGQYGYPQNGQYGRPQNNAPYGAQQNQPAPPPVPAQLTVQRGTYITVRVNQMLSSDKNQQGDAFTASLVQPLVVNGVVLAEPGQTVGGRVAEAEKHHYDKPARLGLQLTNMDLVDGQQIPISTQFISRTGGTTSGGTEFGTVATTTGVGAIIGAAAGWGTGAAIGAGAGAAAGLIGVLVTHNHASVIYPEQVLTFRIEAPVTISTVNSSQAFRYIQPNEYDRPTYANYSGNGMYESSSPAPVYAGTYGYPYPYYGYGYGWGYPYYWGPSFAFYGGYWGGRYYGRGYYGGRYYGGAGYYGGGRAAIGGGTVRSGVAGGGFHSSAGHSGGGHR